MPIFYYSLHIKGISNKFFTYSSFEKYRVGEWVSVKFRNRVKAAIIIEEELDFKGKFKVLEIIKRVDFHPMDERMMKLLLWISKYYIEDFNLLLGLYYPRALDLKSDTKIVLGPFPEELGEEEELVRKYVKRYSPVLLKTLEKKFSSNMVKEYISKGYLLKVEEHSWDKVKGIEKKEITNHNVDKSVILTKEQEEIVKSIEENKRQYHLIHGVTGSGKTEIYAAIVKKALERGEGSIFLLPEISLTAQFILRFRREFGENVAIIHSKLSAAERKREWVDIQRGNKKVVLGVRSAVFSPVKNLKYIILDEEHETSYKQENSPRYDARLVAAKRVALENGTLVLGSATPRIESYFHASKDQIALHSLNSRYMSRPMPEVQIVDMKKEPKTFIGKALLDALKVRIERKEQSIIITSRKGFSSSTQCGDCGHVEECENCSISLVYHKKSGSLRCHYCDFEKKYINRCSSCGLFNINMLGFGTEKIFEVIAEKLPEANVVRVDGDLSAEEYQKAYSKFLDEKYDIMVGTRLVSKGFHFPNVTLVGIVDADALLYFPDFRASERAFQLITQASGRAGREEKKGEVLLQSHVPENCVMELSKEGDYLSFYEEEISFREKLGYPPFGRLINLIISSVNENRARNLANSVYVRLKQFKAFKPVQAPIYIVNKRYRFHIFIRSSRSRWDEIKKRIGELPSSLKKGGDRILVDVDPVSFL